MIKSALILSLLIFWTGTFAQSQKKGAPITIRGTIGIPRSVSSRAFNTAFNGVYEGSVSVNKRLFGNFFVGLGYQNTHFQNNKQVFAYKVFVDPNGKATGATLSYNTRLNAQGGFIKFGIDRYYEKVYVTYALNAGYMYCAYKNVHLDTNIANKPFQPLTFTAPYLEPEISLNFLMDGRLNCALLFGYGTMLSKFDPKAPRFNGFDEVAKKHNHYFISWINIGFGVNVLLGDMR